MVVVVLVLVHPLFKGVPNPTNTHSRDSTCPLCFFLIPWMKRSATIDTEVLEVLTSKTKTVTKVVAMEVCTPLCHCLLNLTSAHWLC